MLTNDDPLGGQGELTRSDLDLIRQAARNDWPVPPDVRAKIVDRLVGYLDLSCEEGATAPDRIVLGAARALAAFCGLSLKQQQLDLLRERIEGRKSGLTVAELVGEAEARAVQRRAEREKE